MEISLFFKCIVCWFKSLEWLDWLSLAGLFLMGFGIYKFFKYPIKRDRILARGIWSTALIVIAFIIVVPFAVSAIALVFNVNAENITTGTEAFKSHSRFISLLYHFTDPGNLGDVKAGHTTELVFAWVCGLLGVFLFAGLFVSTIVNLVDKRTEMWQKGLIRYNHNFSNYVVIIGGNEQVAAVVKDSLKKPGVKYVLILTSGDVENLRMRINASLSRREEGKVVIYYGDPTSLEEIKGLRLRHAREIYILGESARNDVNDDHDAFNMNTLRHVATCAKREGDKMMKRLKCHVAIEHQSTFSIFSNAEIKKRLTDRIEFLPFNIDEIWAKHVLVKRNYCLKSGREDEQITTFNYKPLWGDKQIGPDSPLTVHLVIIGTDSMGVALALEAARLIHFPNFVNDHSRRTTITFISRDAMEEANFMRGRFPHLFALSRSRAIDLEKESLDKPWHDPMTDSDNPYRHLGENFIDIQWEFIQADIADPKVRDYLVKLVDDPNQITTVAVTLNHAHKSLAAALYLPDKVLQNAVQVLVYQSNKSDIADFLSLTETSFGKYVKLRPFGMIENCYEDNSADTIKAKLLNYYYATKKEGLNSHPSIEEINKAWEGLSLPKKWSSNHNIDSIEMKLAAAGSSPEESPEEQLRKLTETSMLYTLACAEHNRWVVERLIAGLRPLYDVEDEWQFFNRQEIREMSSEANNVKKERKNDLKDRGIHIDILSNELLVRIDSEMPANDRNLVCAIPKILYLAIELEKQSDSPAK